MENTRPESMIRSRMLRMSVTFLERDSITSSSASEVILEGTHVGHTKINFSCNSVTLARSACISSVINLTVIFMISNCE